MPALIQKASGRDKYFKDTDYMAYFNGNEIKGLKVYFDGDDYSIFSRVTNSYLRDEHGCQFFGLETAENLVAKHCENRKG